MADQLKASLENIRAANGKLSMLDDQVSAAIRRVEDVLRDRIGVRISIMVRLSNQDEMVLAFTKLDGKWCLALEGRGNRAPLLSAPRDIRAEVFVEGYIEHLIRTAPDQLHKMITEREGALASATGLIDALAKSAAACPPSKERRRG